MQIALLSAGTRGDVQPLLALAWRLRARGHGVRLAVPADFVATVERAGMPGFSLGPDVGALMRSPRGRAALSRGDVLSFATMLVAEDRRHDRTANLATQAAMEGADLVLGNPLAIERGSVVAASMGIPATTVCAAPLASTRSFASPLLPFDNLRFGLLNQLLSELLLRAMFGAVWWPIWRFRRSFGLPRPGTHALWEADRRGTTVLHAWSQHLQPRPLDWGPHHQITGFWGVPAEVRAVLGEAEPDPTLTRWLEGGEPPGFVGFGSMAVVDPRRTFDAVTQAARRTGQRVLIGAGWSELPEGDQGEVFVARALDHSTILPRCRWAVHHGGAGTTAASLQAGLPTWICAFLADQPWWGRRCVSLGVGGWSWLRDMDEAAFSRVFEGLSQPMPRARAVVIGELLRAEDGLSEAVRLVEERLPGERPPR